MKPPAFRYHDPTSVAEVIGLLATHENARLLAGGQSLMAMLNLRYVLPDHIVDLNRVEGLAYIGETPAGLTIGAMTRQRDLEFSNVIKVRCPLMSEAILHVGHRQTRNRGTIGGSLCHLDPSAELVCVAAAHDARLRVVGPSGERDIPFAEFPAGYMTPNMAPDEMLVGIDLPFWPPGHGYGFVEFTRRHGDFAIVSAAALIEEKNGRIARTSLTLGGVATAPLRMNAAEKILVGNTLSDSLLREAAESCRDVNPMDDIHAPAAYRRHLAVVLARRALTEAAGKVARA